MDTDTEGENEPDKSALVPSQQSDITEPSSSYERLVNQDPFSPLPQATQPVHQIAETQAVDYSKPTQEVDATSILQRHDFWQGQQLVHLLQTLKVCQLFAQTRQGRLMR